MSRAAVAFAGRGAYGPSSLGSLPKGHAWVRRADELRSASGLEPLSALDAADRFEPSRHLRPSNAWPLIFLAGLLDAERIADDHEVVVVLASSTGWYTALAASGALDFDDGMRLVQAMAGAAEAPLEGKTGELIYPLTDEAWRPDPACRRAVGAALEDVGDAAGLAVDLGGFAMIGGTEPALDRVAGALPAVHIGGRDYPLRLRTGDGWHTPLRASAGATAADGLRDLAWAAPNVTLIDGSGRRFTPWSTDPADLARVSLEQQSGTTYDFAAAVRVALREYAPDVLLLPGPGASLGAACAQIMVAEGYRGMRSRAEFEQAQAGPAPVLLSMRR